MQGIPGRPGQQKYRVLDEQAPGRSGQPVAWKACPPALCTSPQRHWPTGQPWPQGQIWLPERPLKRKISSPPRCSRSWHLQPVPALIASVTLPRIPICLLSGHPLPLAYRRFVALWLWHSDRPKHRYVTHEASHRIHQLAIVQQVYCSLAGVARQMEGVP